MGDPTRRVLLVIFLLLQVTIFYAIVVHFSSWLISRSRPGRWRRIRAGVGVPADDAALDLPCAHHAHVRGRAAQRHDRDAAHGTRNPRRHRAREVRSRAQHVRRDVVPDAALRDDSAEDGRGGLARRRRELSWLVRHRCGLSRARDADERDVEEPAHRADFGDFRRVRVVRAGRRRIRVRSRHTARLVRARLDGLADGRDVARHRGSATTRVRCLRRRHELVRHGARGRLLEVG